MLEQIVYTRCKPHRSFEDNGKVRNEEGFGIFSFSKGVLSKEIISYTKFLSDYLLSIKNVSDESEEKIGLIESYDYIVINNNTSAFINHYSRPKGTIPRKNGIAHRPGNYINQAYIGDMPNLYPFEFFGSKIWDAKLISENDYYLDDEGNNEPDFLNSINKVFQGNVDKKRVKEFLSIGNKKECLVDAIWFLINQYSKPEDIRKILLIKDLPQNVELWVAAIMFGFPKYLAKKISFSTNRVIETNRVADTLFYYTDESGKVVSQTNRVAKRHPLFMIVGYHPFDPKSKLVEKNNDFWAILDGSKEVLTSSPTDRETLSSYYKAVINNNQDIEDFCQSVLPELQITEISDRIPIVYNAYDYLLNSDNQPDSWKYQNTRSLFEVFLKNGIEKSADYSNYLLDKIISVYIRFVDDDIENNFLLYKDLLSLANHDNKVALENIISERHQVYINNINKYLKKIFKFESDLKKDTNLNNLKDLFYNGFDDNFVQNYIKLQLPILDADSIFKVFELYFRKLEFDNYDINTIFKEESKYNFFFFTIKQLWFTKSYNTLKQVFTHILKSDLFTHLALNIYKNEIYGLELEKRKIFSDFIISFFDNILNTVKSFCDCKSIDLNLIEFFFSDRLLIEGKYNDSIRLSFKYYLDNTEINNVRGKLFFDNWIKIARDTDFLPVCSELFTCKIDNGLKKHLFIEYCKKNIPDSWRYQDVLSLFEVFLKNGIEKSVEFTNSLLDTIIRIYIRFVEDDIENNLSLFGYLICLANQEKKEDLEGIILKKQHIYINSINKYLKKILKLESDLKSNSSFINLKNVFYKAFDDDFLLNFTNIQLSTLDSDSISKVFELYCRKLEFDNFSFNRVIKDEIKYNFFFLTIKQIWGLKSTNILKQVLPQIIKSDLFTHISLNFYKNELCHLDLEKRKIFLEIIIKLCGNILDVTKKFCGYKDVDISLIEKFIADWILIERKCDNVTRLAFEYYLNNTETSNDKGKQFFISWIEIANRLDFLSISTELFSCKIDNDLKKSLFFENCKKCFPGFSLVFKKDDWKLF